MSDYKSNVDPKAPIAKADGPRSIDEAFSIKAVIVCDKYSDFLAHTLPSNKFIFDRLVVVTSWEDKATRKLCEFHHVECVTTDRIESRKGKFCKGAGINDGLAQLPSGGWRVHMDADILLPPQTRSLLQGAHLDPTNIYGVDRFNVVGYGEFDEFRGDPKLQHEAGAYVHMNTFPIGTRLMQVHADGYIPIGFFQLWHPGVSGIERYPEGHTDAGREDMLFAMQWPRSHRALIPEVVAYHLETEDAGMGSNWKGRTTKLFRHEPYSDSAKRL